MQFMLVLNQSKLKIKIPSRFDFSPRARAREASASIATASQLVLKRASALDIQAVIKTSAQMCRTRLASNRRVLQTTKSNLQRINNFYYVTTTISGAEAISQQCILKQNNQFEPTINLRHF